MAQRKSSKRSKRVKVTFEGVHNGGLLRPTFATEAEAQAWCDKRNEGRTHSMYTIDRGLQGLGASL